MEDKNKLFVFEKKEVILIFLFIALICVISFTLGVRTGKQLSLKHDDYTQEDVRNIDLKSVEEENVEESMGPNETSDFESSMDKTSESKNTKDMMETRLREEMEKLAREDIGKINEQKVAEKKPEVKKEETVAVNPYDGKYTIQLFSHQSKEIAQDFADGFIAKGYDVIINEVVIPGKGKWYRVGIGLFDNVNSAKEYLNREKKLFQNQKYVIQQI